MLCILTIWFFTCHLPQPMLTPPFQGSGVLGCTRYTIIRSLTDPRPSPTFCSSSSTRQALPFHPRWNSKRKADAPDLSPDTAIALCIHTYGNSCHRAHRPLVPNLHLPLPPPSRWARRSSQATSTLESDIDTPLGILSRTSRCSVIPPVPPLSSIVATALPHRSFTVPRTAHTLFMFTHTTLQVNMAKAAANATAPPTVATTVTTLLTIDKNVVASLDNVSFSGTQESYKQYVAAFNRALRIHGHALAANLQGNALPTPKLNVAQNLQLHDFLVISCTPNSAAFDIVNKYPEDGTSAWIALRRAYGMAGFDTPATEKLARVHAAHLKFAQLKCVNGDEFNWLSDIIDSIHILSQHEEYEIHVSLKNIVRVVTYASEKVRTALIAFRGLKFMEHPIPASGEEDSDVLQELMDYLYQVFRPLPQSSGSTSTVGAHVYATITQPDLSRSSSKSSHKPTTDISTQLKPGENAIRRFHRSETPEVQHFKNKDKICFGCCRSDCRYGMPRCTHVVAWQKQNKADAVTRRDSGKAGPASVNAVRSQPVIPTMTLLDPNDVGLPLSQAHIYSTRAVTTQRLKPIPSAPHATSPGTSPTRRIWVHPDGQANRDCAYDPALFDPDGMVFYTETNRPLEHVLGVAQAVYPLGKGSITLTDVNVNGVLYTLTIPDVLLMPDHSAAQRNNVLILRQRRFVERLNAQGSFDANWFNIDIPNVGQLQCSYEHECPRFSAVVSLRQHVPQVPVPARVSSSALQLDHPASVNISVCPPRSPTIVTAPDALQLHQMSGCIHWVALERTHNCKFQRPFPVCPLCSLGKARAQPIPRLSTRHRELPTGQMLFRMDLNGPFKVPSSGGSRYIWLICLDSIGSDTGNIKIGTVWLYYLRSKNDTSTRITDWILDARRDGLDVGSTSTLFHLVHSDNGRAEFRSQDIRRCLLLQRLTDTTGGPYCPSQSLMEFLWTPRLRGGKCVLLAIPGSPPDEVWPYAIDYCNLQIMRTVDSNGTSPLARMESFTGCNVPRLHCPLPRFGARLWLHTPGNTTAMQPTATECVYLGLSVINTCAYALKKSGVVVETFHAKIDTDLTLLFVHDRHQHAALQGLRARLLNPDRPVGCA